MEVTRERNDVLPSYLHYITADVYLRVYNKGYSLPSQLAKVYQGVYNKGYYFRLNVFIRGKSSDFHLCTRNLASLCSALTSGQERY
jgi:hypothetical protein